jgi:hypothetical protein
MHVACQRVRAAHADTPGQNLTKINGFGTGRASAASRIRKPSPPVSFNLGGYIRVCGHAHAIVTADRGAHSDRESARVELHGRPTRHLRECHGFEDHVPKDKTQPTSKGCGKAAAPRIASTSAKRVVVQNLINMAVVIAGSGTVLLGLLTAKHFQIARF